MPFDPVQPSRWDALGRVRPVAKDLFKRFRAIDADIYGNLTARSGSITGDFMISGNLTVTGDVSTSGDITTTGDILVDPGGELRIGTSTDYLRMYGNAGFAAVFGVDDAFDNPGSLYFNASGNQAFQLQGMHDDDQLYPVFRADVADSAAEAGYHYQFGLSDPGAATKHFDHLIYVADIEPDMVGLRVAGGGERSEPTVLIEGEDSALVVNNSSASSPNDLAVIYDDPGDTGGGLHTRQNFGRLPAMVGQALTDLTPVGGTGDTNMTGTASVLAGGVAQPVRAIAFGQVTAFANAVTGSVRARIEYSLDGGSTWSNGKYARGWADANDDYDTLTPVAYFSGTPTGNIQARMSVLSSNASTHFINGDIMLIVFGDIT